MRRIEEKKKIAMEGVFIVLYCRLTLVVSLASQTVQNEFILGHEGLEER